MGEYEDGCVCVTVVVTPFPPGIPVDIVGTVGIVGIVGIGPEYTYDDVDVGSVAV